MTDVRDEIDPRADEIASRFLDDGADLRILQGALALGLTEFARSWMLVLSFAVPISGARPPLALASGEMLNYVLNEYTADLAAVFDADPALAELTAEIDRVVDRVSRESPENWS